MTQIQVGFDSFLLDILKREKPRPLKITKGLATIDLRIEEYRLGRTPSMFDDSNKDPEAHAYDEVING